MDSHMSNWTADTTLHGLLGKVAAATPDAAFLHTDDDTVTFAEFEDRVDRIATAWLRLGIGHGDRIAIAAINSVDWMVAYLATAKIGAILVTLNIVYREREFVHMLGQSGARILICDAQAQEFAFEPFLNAIRPQLPDLEHLIMRGADTFTSELRWEDVAATTVDSESVAAAAALVRPDDPVVILYTSGTTGTPKGAILTHRSLLASATAQAERFSQTAADVTLSALPMNHVGGLTVSFGAALVVGGGIAIVPRFRPDLVHAVMRRTPVSIIGGVPTMYAILLEAAPTTPVDTSAVRLCVVGGSNLEPALAAKVLAAYGSVRLANLYGLSETSGACVISPPTDSLDQVGHSIGTTIGDFEARIVDADRNPVAAGASGELQFRGECVAAGYWQMPAETAATFLADGWLATGDVGTMSEDGHISLIGRSKEMYVRGGYNVYPIEIENVLASHPSVLMSAVIGYPDPTFGEKGCAFIVPAPGAVVETEELTALCRRMLAHYKVPDRFEIVDQLPMTPAGKIRKVELSVRQTES